MNYSSVVMPVSQNEFYKRYCRVCGSDDGICIDLFTDRGKNYLTKVQKLLNIKIDPTDHLPRNICHICMSFIADFDEYRKHCNIIQEKLNNLANNFNKQSETEVESSKRLTNNCTSIKKNVDPQHSKNIPHSSQTKTIRSADSNENSCIENKKKAQTTNLIDDFVLNKPNTDPEEANDWTVQRLPGKTTVLYICNKCHEMMLCESAIRSHQCIAMSKVTDILSSNQLSLQENDDVKTKRKRIVSADD